MTRTRADNVAPQNRRRELLIETSRRRLDRLGEKLKMVRKKLLGCNDQQRPQWAETEKDLVSSLQQEQSRLERLESELGGELPTPSPAQAEPPESSLAKQLAELRTAFEQLQKDHEQSQGHVARHEQSLDSLILELTGTLEEREDLYRRLAGQEEQRAALAETNRDLEHALEDTQDLHKQDLDKLEQQLRDSLQEKLALEAELAESERRNRELNLRFQEELEATHQLLEETLEEKDLEVDDLQRRLAAEVRARQELPPDSSELLELLNERDSENEDLRLSLETQEDLFERSEAARRALQEEVTRIKASLDALLEEHRDAIELREEQGRIIGALAGPSGNQSVSIKAAPAHPSASEN